MPIHDSSYAARHLLKNGHFQTIFPTFFRRLPLLEYTRERIETPDGDFLDLDWFRNRSRNLAILSHGMEGSSYSQYIIGMAAYLKASGWDSLAWNFRGCSGEFNRKIRFYHSGASDDLATVVRHAIASGRYEKICLIGYSMGGNITLKYLGEQSRQAPGIISKAVTFGVPCDLRSSVMQLAKRRNSLYMRRFLKSLGIKMRQKASLFPDLVSLEGYNKIRNFIEFDQRYTAPIHGFGSAEEYWSACSSKRFLNQIETPALIVNALDDPFLGKACFPYEEARKNRFLTLETPRYGGHIGFISFNKDGVYWSEKRAIEFLSS